MIRIMLVDDEALIRVAIKTLFSWEEYGFQIVAEANNGEIALRKLKQERIDLVITDIKMPIIDGIALIKEIRTQYPSVICVVLSNYEDFTLTRSAFREGAVDYLLKGNLKPESFLELVHRLKENYFQELPLEAAASFSSTGNETSDRKLLLQQFLAGTDDTKNYLSSFPGEKPYRLVSIRLSGITTVESVSSDSLSYSQNEALIKQTVLKIISEISEFDSVYYAVSTQEYIYFVYQTEFSETAFHHKLSTFFTSLTFNIQIYLNMITVIGVSSLYSNPLDADKAWMEADRLSQNIFYCTQSEHLFAEDAILDKQSVKSFILQNIDMIQQHAINQNIEALTNLFNQILDLLAQTRYAPDAARHLIANLEFLVLSEIAHSSGKETDFIFHRQPVQNRLYHVQNITSLRQAVEDFLNEIILEGDSDLSETGSLSLIVQSAIAYLSANFSNPETSLSSTALAVSTNASYLSRIFYKETRIHFNTYLTNLRINYAKGLLLEHKETISRIAEKCGYNNPKYFINIFKKTTNMTPSEFQRKAAKRDQDK